MRKIDDQAYKDGGAAFNKGKSLRQLMEMLFAEPEKEEERPNWQEREIKTNSTMLGYADAFIFFMRSKR